MLFLKKDRKLHDCNEIKTGDEQDTDLIQDYKKMSQRAPVGRRIHGLNQLNSCPATPRQFLYSRSPSTSSLSSLPEAEEYDWKLIALTRDGGNLATCFFLNDLSSQRSEFWFVVSDNSIVALVTLNNELSTLSIVQRLNTPSGTPNDLRSSSVERGDSYVCVTPMTLPRCGLGTGKLKNKLLACGLYFYLLHNN